VAGWGDRWARLASSRGAASAVLVISLLAVLGTSPARWRVSAVLAGPASATKGRGLDLVITSSLEPNITASGVAKPFSRGVPCLSAWSPATRVSCLLPPGALIEDVAIEGTCGGCTGPCVPPKGSFVTADSSEVDVWKDVVTSKGTFTLPSHGRDFVATTFEIDVDGADYVEVELEVSDPSSAWRLPLDRQSCRRHPSVTTPFCTFLVYDSSLPKGSMSATLSARATGWGRCAGAGCAPPGTLRIVSIGVQP
jgi:hypothetical protein